MFESYFEGFKERHSAISSACRESVDGIVLYTDIKRFYPNISTKLARNAWLNTCKGSDLSGNVISLGEKLLDHHSAVGAEKCKGLLTGPMFSHLIGNLVLRELDDMMSEVMPKKYFRYVDDIVLVGNKSKVLSAREQIEIFLGEKELKLHNGDKDFMVPASEWIEGENDFEDTSEGSSWKSLIGGLRAFLLTCPDKRHELTEVFASIGMRIPILDYSGVIRERGYLERIIQNAKRSWFRSRVRTVDIGWLIGESLKLRELCKDRLKLNLDEFGELTGYQRKRRIPKIRYDAGRLLYLAEITDLQGLGSQLSTFPETKILGEVMKAIHSRDVSSLISLGTNATQAAAQLLRLSSEAVVCRPEQWGDAERQGLAILKFNGVKISHDYDTSCSTGTLIQLASWDNDPVKLMKDSDPFIRELACLHGLDQERRYDSLLDSAFDPDESLSFDAISQLHQNSSGY